MPHDEGIDWGKYTPGYDRLEGLESVRDAVQTHGSFRNAVIYFVATWIIGGILTVGRTVVESVLIAFDGVVLAFNLATDAIVGALDSVGVPILELGTRVSGFIAGLAVEAGPAAPVIAVGALALIWVAWARFIKAALLEIPVVGGFLEALGVDL